ncbi:hypothetical protein RISK_004653 [Rhodopirellula islandica]|uniref:Uncharacterized protein n=1 Tax=Rhodopirellula islandica TaxID=595434 RepID=A0A0J1BA20_RHOIS|nr:hypothetical protein RISK_004653 [Rhodopirellula islandica]
MTSPWAGSAAKDGEAGPAVKPKVEIPTSDKTKARTVMAHF